MYERDCGYCGSTFKTTTRASKGCSVSCGRLLQLHGPPGVKSRALVLVPKREPPRRDHLHLRTARRLTSGRCRVCDQWFISFHLDVTCSTECKRKRDRQAKRLHKDKRRAVKRNAYREDVSRRRVFESDSYRCHLCRRKTDTTKQVPHPRAPTIDHVIPLGRGGTHEPSNCRTACFQCNATKSDRGGGEQLLLIAV